MSQIKLIVIIAVFAWIGWSSPARAVYLFLDTNGDGVRTAADVLDPRKQTTATLWLLLEENKKGTEAACSHAKRSGDHHYSIVFQAAGGTVAWGPFTPHLPSPRQTLSTESDDSTYLAVQVRGVDWTYVTKVRLGTFRVRVRRGRPAIEIVSRREAPSAYATRLSTGTWDGPVEVCADGLPYGGQANRPPRFGPFSLQVARAGSSERVFIVGEDLDNDPLTYRVKSGPSFVSVRTRTDGWSEVVVTPDSCSTGTHTCVLEASDGFATDADTMAILVKPLQRPIPSSPVIASTDHSLVLPDLNRSTTRAPGAADWMVGEWERHFVTRRYVGGMLPAEVGYRRRLVIRPGGRADLFDIGPDRVLRAIRTAYQVSGESRGTRLSFSDYLAPSAWREPSAFSATTLDGRYLHLYPWGYYDASAEIFVRVPSVGGRGAAYDTSRLVSPIEAPQVSFEGGWTRATMSLAMKEALRKVDPDFRPYEGKESSGPVDVPGPSAIVGDFDGDLLRDVALLGQSGSDQVVIAVLSNHGTIVAKEVVWRRVRPGKGAYKSRGDPGRVAPIYLECGARARPNPYCWGRPSYGPPIDAVGIVLPGKARFDYVLKGEHFVLHEPVEPSRR